MSLPLRDLVVKHVLPDLRKQKLVARASYMCCMGCATAGLHEFIKDSPDKIGAVYWHKQDDERARRDKNPTLDIRYSQREEGSVGTKAIGDMVIVALKRWGLTYEWDGSPDSTITVTGKDDEFWGHMDVLASDQGEMERLEADIKRDEVEIKRKKDYLADKRVKFNRALALRTAVERQGVKA